MQDPNAVTTMGLVLSEYMNQVKGVYPDINLIYDEQFTLESALTKIRSKREREGLLNNGEEFPLFAFKRSPLKFPEHGMGRRSQVTKLYNPLPNNAQGPVFYKTIYGKLDVPFMFYTEAIEDEEIFEVEFMTEDRISSIKELNVEITDLGVFNFFASYSPIEEKTIQSKDLYYKVVQGTVSLLGWYLVIEGKGNIITEIRAKIETFKSEIMAEIDIVGT